MKDNEQQKEPVELSVFEKLERAITKKLKIIPDQADDAANRRAALRSLRLNKGEMAKALQTRVDIARLKLHNQQLNDLEVIEGQYTNYFKNISWKNNYHRTDEGISGFHGLIDKSKISQNTKDLLKLKAKTPFRLNLKDFENPEPNVVKYYEMIGFDKFKEQGLDPSVERSEEKVHLSVDVHKPPVDEALKLGKFITQPSLTDLQDYFNTNSESILKIPKEKSMLSTEPANEYSLPLKPKQVARQKLFGSVGVKDDPDKQSTRYTNQTALNTKESDFFSTSKTAPHRNFLIKSNFRPLRTTSKRDIKSFRDKFDQLTSLCTEQSSQFSTQKQREVPEIVLKTQQRGQSTTRIRHSTLQNKESSTTLHPRVSHRLTMKGPEEMKLMHRRSRSNLNRSSMSSSPLRKIRKEQATTEEGDEQDNLKNIASYIDSLINSETSQPSKQPKYFQKKQYKKLDIKEKIELEVKRMFDANYKGPGGKSAALLASMLHHYIAFGTPGASKMEVTQKVREFLTKHKVKISLEELKKLAAEKHFYITSVQ